MASKDDPTRSASADHLAAYDLRLEIPTATSARGIETIPIATR